MKKNNPTLNAAINELLEFLAENEEDIEQDYPELKKLRRNVLDALFPKGE